MPGGGFDAGRVYVTLGYDLDDKVLKQYDAQIQKLRAEKPVQTTLSFDYDSASAKAYEAEIAKLRAAPNVKTKLSFDYDKGNYDRYLADVAKAKAAPDVKQTIKVDYDRSAFDRLSTDSGRAERDVASLGNTSRSTENAISSLLGTASKGEGVFGGWTSGLGGILTLALTAGPAILALAGAVGALVGSLGAAIAGLGALGVGLGGTFLPVVALAVGVFSRLAAVTKAYQAQNVANASTSRNAAAAARSQASSIDSIKAAQDGLISATVSLKESRISLTRAEQNYTRTVEETRKHIEETRDAEVRAARDVGDAEKNLAQQRIDAARAVEDAQRHVEDSTIAQADAARRVQQLQAAGDTTSRGFFDAQRTLSSATTEANRAQQDNAKFAAQGTAAYQPLQDALRRLADATKEYHKRQQDLVKAEKEGIADAPAVISASDAVRRAHESVASSIRGEAAAERSLAAARRGAAGAASGVNSAQQRANQLTGELDPVERDLIKKVRSIIKSFRDATREGVDAILAGLDSGLARIPGFLEKLKPSFTSLGKTLGSVTDGFFKDLTGPRWTSAWKIFANAARPVMKDLARITEDWMAIFRDIAIAVLPDLKKSLGNSADSMDELAGKIHKALGDGTLEKTIHSLVTSFRDWWKLLKDFGKLLIDFFGAGKKTGDSMTESLDKTFQKWDKWIHNHPTEIQAFFKEARAFVDHILEVLGPILAGWLKFSEALINLATKLPVSWLEAFGAAWLALAVTSKFAGAIKVLTLMTGLVGKKLPTLSPTAAPIPTGRGTKVPPTVPVPRIPGENTSPGGVILPSGVTAGEEAVAPAVAGDALGASGIAASASAAAVPLAILAGALVAVGGAIDDIKTNFAGAGTVVKAVVSPFRDLARDTKKLVDTLTGGHADTILHAIGSALEWIGKHAAKLIGLGLIAFFITIAGPIIVVTKGIDLLVKGMNALADASGSVWDLAKKGAKGALDEILGMVTTFLGAVDKVAGGLASAFGWVPGAGGKLKAFHNAIDDAKSSIDNFRETLRGTGDDAPKMTDALGEAAGKVTYLHDKLKTLKKGTDDYRTAADQLKGAQQDLNTALRNAQGAGKRGAAGLNSMGAGATSASQTVEDATATIKTNVDRLAKGLGAQGINFTVAKTPKARRTQDNVFGSPGAFTPGFSDSTGLAMGGWIGRPGERGGDAVSIAVPDGSAIYNAYQQPIIAMARALASRAAFAAGGLVSALVGRGEYAALPHEAQADDMALRSTFGYGLADLFSQTSSTRHYAAPRAGGGPMAVAASARDGGPRSHGAMPPVPTDLLPYDHAYPMHHTGTRGTALPQGVISRIQRWAGLPLPSYITQRESSNEPGILEWPPEHDGAQGYGLWQLTTGHVDPPVVALINRLGGWNQMFNPLKNALAASKLYHMPGGGPGRWNTYGGGSAGSHGSLASFAPSAVATPTLPGLTVKGPAGALRQIAQKAINRGVGAGQSFLDGIAPISTGGPSPLGPNPGGPGGTVMFQGFPVAAWIAKILRQAQGDGVPIQVSSGFRTYAKQLSLWNLLGHDRAIVAPPGTSNHEGSAYPRGAVDLTGSTYGGLAAWLTRHPNVPLHHYTEPRDPYHFSARGNAAGGFVGRLPFAGSFAGGGRPRKPPAAGPGPGRGIVTGTPGPTRITTTSLPFAIGVGGALEGSSAMPLDMSLTNPLSGDVPPPTVYTDQVKAITILGSDYNRASRRYSQITEPLLNEQTGQLDTDGIQQRLRVLAEILDIRQWIVQAYQDLIAIVQRIIAAHNEVIRRLTAALPFADKTAGTVISAELGTYTSQLHDWEALLDRSNPSNLPDALADAQFDVIDTQNEIKAVQGTKPDASAAPTAATPEAIAELALAQLASFQSSRASLFGSFGQNFVQSSVLSRLGLGYGGALSEAAGTRFFGAVPFAASPTPIAGASPTANGSLPTSGGPGGVQIIQNYAAPPPDPHTYTKTLQHELDAVLG